MGQKLKIAGWISVGALAGALTTVSLQTVARGGLAPLPLEELQQLAAVFGMIKSDYVEPVDEKKLITEAIAGWRAAHSTPPRTGAWAPSPFSATVNMVPHAKRFSSNKASSALDFPLALVPTKTESASICSVDCA